MPSRTRTRCTQQIFMGNHEIWVLGERYEFPKVGYDTTDETCEDDVGDWEEDNPLNLVRDRKIRGRVYGEVNDPITGAPLKRVTNFPMDWDASPPEPNLVFPEPDEVAQSSYAWKAMAKSNPSRPHIGVPTALGELKDLPSLIYGWGKGVIGRVASGYLQARWAISPMISDLQALLGFAQAVEARNEDFAKMQGSGYLNADVGISQSRVNTVERGIYGHTSTGIMRVDTFSEYTEKIWCSLRWRMTDPVVLPTLRSDRRRATARIVGGINSWGALMAAWELFPWSWFADWFLGLQTVLSALNNTVGCSASGLCLMRTATAKRRASRVDAGSDEWLLLKTQPFQSRVRKQRMLIAPFVPFVLPTTFPIFDRKKWSILLALAALRARL